jgi:hypothetical protein
LNNRKRLSYPQWSLLVVLLVTFTVLVPSRNAQLSSQANAGPEDDTAFPAEADHVAPCDGWEQPNFALFVTGRQHGYIEPCGCTGLDQAKGGLSRRHTLLNQLKDRGWDVVCVDVGNQVRRVGRQPEIKFQTTARLLRLMGYAAIGFGPDDLKLSSTELLSAIVEDAEGTGNFVSANASLFGELPAKFNIVAAGDHRIGITAVVGKQTREQITSEDITVADMAASLTPIVAQLENEKCDKLVLLAHCTLEETGALAKQFPMFDIIVTAGGAGEPTLEPATVEGSKARIVQAGTKGIYVGVVGFYDDATPLRYDRIMLDSQFPDSHEVLEAFALYQQQLRDAGLEGLGLRPVRHPRSTKEAPRTFVGHEVCGDCHTTAYETFESTPHFHATKSIAEPTERSNIKRHFDPECLSCHVTGWNAQGYFPYVSGYLSLEESVALHSNGCENCHGPGSAHVAVENGDVEVSEAEQTRLREEMRLTLEEAKTSACYDCHDQDNSPEFDFETYWPQVEHYGMD